jgi:hypothetical protein
MDAINTFVVIYKAFVGFLEKRSQNNNDVNCSAESHGGLASYIMARWGGLTCREFALSATSA